MVKEERLGRMGDVYDVGNLAVRARMAADVSVSVGVNTDVGVVGRKGKRGRS